MTKWLLLVIYLDGANIDNYQLFAGPSEKECHKAEAIVQAIAKKEDTEIFTTCVEMKFVPIDAKSKKES